MREVKKVFIVTSFNKPWDNGWYIKNGFEKNGIEALCLDYKNTKNAYEEIIDTIKKRNPQFILFTKDDIPVAVLEEIKRKFSIRLIQWYPDPVIPKWLPPYVGVADVFFTMSEGLIERFKEYNPCVFWLTQAFEPSFFEVKDITRKDIKTFSSEITFVGNLGSKPQYLLRRKYLERVINEGFQLKWWGPRIPRKVSTLPLVLGRLGKSYGGKFVWGEEYAKVARLSKIFLAFDSMPKLRKSMSARMYTAVGCDAFYMCQYVEGIEDVLEPDKEIVTFQTEEEMINKIHFYLNHDSLRAEISEAGKKRVLKEHTYEMRIRQMLKIIEEIVC